MLIKLIKPYTRIHIPFISKVRTDYKYYMNVLLPPHSFFHAHDFLKLVFLFKELNIEVPDVESLLVQCILDK